MSLKFTNLHGHTSKSIFDAIGSPEEYANWVLKNDDSAGGFAITDHGHLSAVGDIVAVQKKFKDKLRIFYGVESYYLPSLEDWAALKRQKEEEKDNPEVADLVIENESESRQKHFDPLNRRNHLVLVAQNQIGLKNLFRLVSRSYRQGFYRKPRIDFSLLKECNEGLIASTACISGIPSYLSLQNADKDPSEVYKAYEKELLPLMELFGKDRFFLELQFNKLPEQQSVNAHLIEYAKRTGFNLIATADCHYPDPSLFRDREIYRLLGHQQQKKLTDLSILEKTVDELDCQLYLKNGDQIFEAYKSTFGQTFTDDQLIIDAIQRTHSIAQDTIENVYPDDTVKLPKTFQVTEKIKTAYDQLKQLCLTGLKQRNLVTQEYIDRTAYELKIINKLGFSEYFLTVKEILDVLRKYMLLGAGRGSGGGSLVNYLLDVTLVDPLKNTLLFERFLSPSRKELPDVDSDCAEKDIALEIIQEHFGEENVLAISNYNRLQLKSLVKDISRLYGVEFQEVNMITKVMEDEAKPHIMEEIGHDQKLYQFTFEKAKQYSPAFLKFLTKYPDIGKHIENLYQEIKSIGKHAGGVLVVPNAEECLPIIKIRGVCQSPITEGITAQHLKFFGLVKFDVLGLATLRVIQRCVEIVLKEQGKINPSVGDVWEFYNKHLHPDIIDPKDPKIFEKVYHKGKFLGVFQFAEKGVQKFCKRAKPNSVDDVSTITALWRPGALKDHGDKKYLKFKQKDFELEHPIIQEILGKSRGVLVFQEQFMLLAHKLAGFTLEEADNLRKLLVKPATSLAEEMKKERIEVGNKFIQGCIDKGLTKERAERLWKKEILGFISYGFNESHSKCYAFNSYQCAYLLTYHEKEWIRACLECDPDLQETINNVRALGYDIAKPDINHSAGEWMVKDKVCYPSLTSLKGVGEVASRELIERRGKNGGFKDLNDFLFDQEGKWRWNKLNKKSLEVLIKTNAFESLNCVGPLGIFNTYKHMYDALLGGLDQIRKKKVTVEEVAKMVPASDWTVKEKMDFQKEIVGFYDKVSVLKRFEKMFKEFEITAIDEVEDSKDKEKIWIIVEECTEKLTKNNRPFLFVKCSGRSEKTYDFRVWNQKKQDVWSEGNVLVLSLSFDKDFGYALSKGCDVLAL